MIIDFNKIENSVIPKFKDGTGEFSVHMYTDNLGKIMLGKLEPGSSIGMHTHEGNSEIIYVLKGCGKVLFDDAEEKVSEGLCHYCPKGHSHSLINDSDDTLLFFAVVPEHNLDLK